MPATRTATASARCTSTPWRVSGHCSAPGCVRIAASRRRSCQSISASSSSCTTRAGAEKPCSAPLSLLWSGDVLHPPEAGKSLRKYLKVVGVTSQREIELAVRAALAKGTLVETSVLKPTMILRIPEIGLNHVIDGEIALE